MQIKMYMCIHAQWSIFLLGVHGYTGNGQLQSGNTSLSGMQCIWAKPIQGESTYMIYKHTVRIYDLHRYTELIYCHTYTNIHTYITLYYITLHYIALHYITLHT